MTIHGVHGCYSVPLSGRQYDLQTVALCFLVTVLDCLNKNAVQSLSLTQLRF